MKNLVILIGNVGNAPDVKVFDDGGKIVRVSLATSETYHNDQGEKITNTEWHVLIFKGKLADIAEKYVEKGKKLAVEGRIKTREYLNENSEKRYVTEIIVKEITLL